MTLIEEYIVVAKSCILMHKSAANFLDGSNAQKHYLQLAELAEEKMEQLEKQMNEAERDS